MDTQTESQETTPETGATGGAGGGGGGLAADIANEFGAVGAAGAAATAAKPKNKGGRPPIHGRYAKAAGSDGKNPVPDAGPGTVAADEMESGGGAGVVVPPDVLAGIVRSSLEAVSGSVVDLIRKAGAGAGLTADELRPQLERAQIGDRRIDVLVSLAPDICREWGLDPSLSPSTAAGLILAPWGFGAYTAFTTLAKIAKDREARELAKEKKAP